MLSINLYIGNIVFEHGWNIDLGRRRYVLVESL